MSRPSHQSLRHASHAGVSGEVWERLEQILWRFETAWQRGERPNLDDYLCEGGAHRAVLLVELVHGDLDYRLKAGEAVRVEHYLERYPELEANPEAVLSLIVLEFNLRQRAGDGNTLAEYVQRFPALAEGLSRRLGAGRAQPSAPAGRGVLPHGPAATVSAVQANERSPGEAGPATPTRLPGPPPNDGVRSTHDIPGYEILEELGHGGMGVVFKARQVKLNRLVALKMVRADRVEPIALMRFLVEAEAVAAIQHPHVVQVYDYGEAASRPFLALEYLSGGTLAERLKTACRLEPTPAATLLGKLADAVQAAHDRGIVHRDLKPANVLFDEAGEPKVADFGLAKRATGADLTNTQAVMGTPAYMAPEQAKGKTKFVGPPADVYALGVILYECLTGTRPFDDEDALVLLRKVAEEEPVAPGKRVVGVPADLDLICLQCLAKEPAERYASAADLAADLKHFARGEPVSVRAAGLVERLAKWTWRKPTLAAAYGLSILAIGLTGLTTGAVWLWHEAAMARDELAVQQQETEIARHEAEAARDREKEARQAVARWEYARTVDLAHREFRENHIQRARLLLEDCRPELRGWEWHYVHRLCYADVLTILDDRVGAGTFAAYSPDGTRIATVGGHVVPEWDASTGKLLRTLDYSASSVAYSPDGSHILIGVNGGAPLLLDAHTGKEVQRFPSAGSHVAISPDGATIASLSGFRSPLDDRDGLILWDRRTGEARKKLPGVSNAVFTKSFSNVVTFNPNGTALAAIRYDPLKGKDHIGPLDYVATIWDVQTAAERLTLRADESIRSVAFSRDGTRIITSGWSDKARVWDVTNGKAVLTLTGPTAEFWKAAFWAAAVSPDNSMIVTAGADRNARVWDAATGTEIATLKGHTSDVCHVCFSPDGRHILTSGDDRTARVWDTPTRGDRRSLWGGWKQDVKRDVQAYPHGRLIWSGPSVRKFVLSRDGRRIATINDKGLRVWDRVIQLWDAVNGSEIRQFKLTPELAWSATNTVGLVGSPSGAESFLAAVSSNAHVYTGYNDSHVGLAWSPDGGRIVTGGPDNVARVWDVDTGRVVLVLHGHTGPVGAVAYSPDGMQIATGGNWGGKAGEEGSAALWDAKTGALLRTLKCQVQYRSVSGWQTWFQTGDGISFSPDGGRVLAWGMGAVVWDAATGQPRIALGPDQPELIRIGPAKLFAGAGFSPDATRIVTASDDGVARVWDAVTGTEVLTLRGQADVRSAAYSPDGTRLITTDLPGTAKIWDAITGAEMLTLLDAGHMAVFSPDGKVLVTGGGSSPGLKRWDSTPVHRGTFTAAGPVAAPSKR